MEHKLSDIFVFSKIEEKTFKYCGCLIKVQDNGDILLDQNSYVEKLEVIERKTGDENGQLGPSEVEELRAIPLWLCT